MVLYFHRIFICIVFMSVCVIITAISYWTEYTSNWTKPVRFYNNFGSGTKVPDGRQEKLLVLLDAVQPELEEKLKNATEKKIIVLYHEMLRRRFTHDRITLEVNPAECGNCEITFDTKKIADEKTAAVIFYFRDIYETIMPESSNRNLKQLYIYWSMEAPPVVSKYGYTLIYEDSYGFNATMTYRRDSDFVSSYDLSNAINTVRQNNNGVYDTAKLIQFKSKKALAIVSNCEITPGAGVRLKMLEEIIATGFGLEAFGECFPQNGIFPGGGRNDMSPEFHRVIRKYKFYFSFENSYHCRDYITEKLFRNAINPPALPVVWGARKEDYEAVVPPDSFIFVEDYSSVSELVKYLDYLDGNDTAYLEYFRWYTTMNPIDLVRYGRRESFCQVCRAVHGINVDDVFNPNYNFTHPVRPLFTNGTAARIIPSLKQWFYGSENNECLN